MLDAPPAPATGAPLGGLPEAASIPTHGRLTREQVVDRIIQINPSATTDFLASFEDLPLRLYLARLAELSGQRGRSARWIRPDGEPAITGPREQ